MEFDVELNNAQGLTHGQVGEVVKDLEKRGIDLRAVKSLWFEPKDGWVLVAFTNGEERVVTDVITKPGGRKVFLPTAH